MVLNACPLGERVLLRCGGVPGLAMCSEWSTWTPGWLGKSKRQFLLEQWVAKGDISWCSARKGSPLHKVSTWYHHGKWPHGKVLAELPGWE